MANFRDARGLHDNLTVSVVYFGEVLGVCLCLESNSFQDMSQDSRFCTKAEICGSKKYVQVASPPNFSVHNDVPQSLYTPV